MKKNLRERKQRLALTVLFSVIVFCFFIVTMAIVVTVIVILIHNGTLKFGDNIPKADSLIINMAIISVVFGTILTFFTSRFPLKPVNHVMNAMNRLASGHFETRLTPSKLLAKHPTVREFTDTFNTMAEELEHTEMLRSDFVNNFSHEFKTPIVSISGFAKLLKSGNLSDEQKAEYVDIIEKECRRLTDMANNVLNLTKIENQKILSDVTAFNLSEQIRECFLLLENAWSAKNVNLRLEFDEHTIQANEELLKQVWINLIDNAIKFTQVGGTIRVSIKESPSYIKVLVSNTGSSIKAENRERIFQKFYQEDESHSTHGNGVGLAIVKRVCELHNGTVSADCGGRFTTFTVMLPKKLQKTLKKE
jgi:signal transduction histidine kinase